MFIINFSFFYGLSLDRTQGFSQFKLIRSENVKALRHWLRQIFRVIAIFFFIQDFVMILSVFFCQIFSMMRASVCESSLSPTKYANAINYTRCLPSRVLKWDLLSHVRHIGAEIVSGIIIKSLCNVIYCLLDIDIRF